MLPISFNVNPCGKVGPIINKAEMYCELTLPGNDNSLLCSFAPVMQSGG